MTLKERIQKDRINAMKEGNTEKKLVLSTLIGELDRIDKDPSDSQVIKKVKSLIDSNIECGNEAENAFLECYLPAFITRSELTNVIDTYIKDNDLSGMKDMGKVMGYLSSTYSGQYDGKIASGIVKKLLA